MTVREAMDVISGALDSLYEFYNDAEAKELFEEIGEAEAVIYELAWSLLEENKRLEKSNRNWRRKCQRLRSKERNKNGI